MNWDADVYICWDTERIQQRQARNIQLGQWHLHPWLHTAIWITLLAVQRHLHIPSEIWQHIFSFLSPWACTACGSDTTKTGYFSINNVMSRCSNTFMDKDLLHKIRSDHAERYSDFGHPYVEERMCVNTRAYHKFCRLCHLPLQLMCCKSGAVTFDVQHLQIFILDKTLVLPTGMVVLTRGVDDDGIIGVKCPQCKIYYEFGCWLISKKEIG